jgi:pre-mRNA-processing factor 40
MKEDQRRQRKLESAFRALLRENEIDYKTDWDETREKLQGEDAFRTLSIEADRVRVFKVKLIFILLCVLIYFINYL